MLTIRKEQMEILRQAAEKEFYKTIFQELQTQKTTNLEECNRDDGISIIRQVSNRAQTYGFESKSEIRFFFHLISIYGMDFDVTGKQPEINEILTSPYKDGSEKILDLQTLLDIEGDW
ncbi:MAG: hypothetical protein L3J28_12100 [Candidatus Polarisedimenticolaceae bacterium]|nr:hypothetical protein [Candidatus Polarisedimenticolaceae bacterium]